MAKITEYPAATEIGENDILLLDGVGGTRTISIQTLANIITGMATVPIVLRFYYDDEAEGALTCAPSGNMAFEQVMAAITSGTNPVYFTVPESATLLPFVRAEVNEGLIKCITFEPMEQNSGFVEIAYLWDGSEVLIELTDYYDPSAPS